MHQQSFFKNGCVKVSSSFDRSTSIELDFENDAKLKNIYIYSKFAQGIMEIFDSVILESSNQRVRVLSGSPGLGKSTFALLICHILNEGKTLRVTKKINSAECSDIKALKNKYKAFANSQKKLMPVFLNGHTGNIEDAFLRSLRSSFERFTKDGSKYFDKTINEISKKRWDFISKWKKFYPDIYKKYLELLKNEGEQADSFESSIKNGTAQARDVFDRIYAQLTGGANVNLYDCDVISVYKEAVSIVQNYGYSGLFVVYDEFGKYLENGIYNPSSLNLQFLQDFAEHCDRSGRSQCHLTLITHLSISQYASQLPVAMQKEWAKIEGRFSETAFYDRGANYFKMIAHVFEKTIQQTDKSLYIKIMKRAETFVTKMNKTGDYLSDLIEMDNCSEILSACFPLHPLTLALLPILSQKIAQNERTLYTFLTRDEEFSLVRFLNTEAIADGKEKFLMPSYLYKYFSQLIAKDTGIGGSYKINLVLSEALNKISSNDTVSHEILCIIALSSIIKNNKYIPTSEQFIRTVLADDFPEKDIKASFRKLKNKNILFYNRVLKQYELYEGSSINVDEEISKLKNVKLTSRRLVEIIKNYYPTRYIAPKNYNFNHTITRFYRTDILSVEDLKSGKFLKAPKYGQEDGLLYYVIPFDKNEVDLAQKIICKNDHTLIVFILPKRFIECRKDIEEFNAISSLYSNQKLMNSSSLIKKELDRYRATLLSSIEALLSPLLGRFHINANLFYTCNKNGFNINHYNSLERELGNILGKEYNKSINLNNELINKHRVSGTISLARRLLLDAIIDKPTKAKSKFGLDGFGPETAIYYAINNLFKLGKVRGKNKLSIASNTAAYNMLKEYKKILIKNPDGIIFKDIMEILIAPPFGLRKGVIPLYIAVFDQALPYPVNHYFDGKYIPSPDGDHYDLLFKFPHLGKIKYSELSKRNEQYLRTIAKLFGVQNTIDISSVVIQIYNWRRKIPEYTLHNTDSISAKKFLISIDSAKEPDRLLFKDILEIFDLKLGKKEALDQFKESFEREKGKIEKVYQDLIKRIYVSLTEALYFIQEKCLGAEKIHVKKSNQLATLYRKTWVQFPGPIKKYRFSKSTMAFINRFNNFDSSMNPFFFMETLADVLTGSHPRHWREDGEGTFLFSLKRTLEEIEIVCEFLNKNFQGESVIAFINNREGKKEFLRLGARSELDEKQKQIKKRISKELEKLSEKDKNNVLLKLLEERDKRSLSNTVSKRLSTQTEITQ